jgi:hypothetical protein
LYAFIMFPCFPQAMHYLPIHLLAYNNNNNNYYYYYYYYYFHNLCMLV